MLSLRRLWLCGENIMVPSSIALIVGGSSGMGLATAKKLSHHVKDVWITGRDSSRLSKAEKEITIHSPLCSVRTSILDLKDIHSVKHFIQEVECETLHIRYLLNSAGFFYPISFLDHTEKDYDDQIGFNKGFFFVTQAVVRNMKHHHQGSIVNIGSMWALQAVKETPSTAYSMQKAGLHVMTRNLAIELAEYQIRVNAVAPAVVPSAVYNTFTNEDKVREQFAAFHPLGRTGTPEDVANAIEFLLSNQSSWITGVILSVDGGVMAGK